MPDSAINEDMSTQELITTYEHVQIDAGGVPIIAGTNMKVVELVMAQLDNLHGVSQEGGTGLTANDSVPPPNLSAPIEFVLPYQMGLSCGMSSVDTQ